jgi:hypothetical protein
MHTGFLWGNLKYRDHLEHEGLRKNMILKCILNKQYGTEETEVFGPLTGTSGGLLSLV